MKQEYPLLDAIDSPDDLRQLTRESLPQLAESMRHFMLDSIAHTGGHFASNFGAVELAIAVHYVFQTPNDRIIWDVGHQSYPHKILTGRRDAMSHIRQHQGIAGFPRRAESPYDAFGTGHSSTSISAALGMAVAAQRDQSERRAIAVIGDGAMTAGMAFEALNNAGNMDTNLLVILNDNDMSISPNVGALNNYLSKLMSGRFYAAARRASEKMLAHVPTMLELAKRAEEHVKGMITPGTLFEEFGFNYIGPIDGHDLPVLIDTLSNIRRLPGPQFLHVVTQKGKGYRLAEENPCLYHGVGSFNPTTGIVSKPTTRQTYTQVFSDWLCDMAAIEPKLIGITPAMREGSGLVRFSEQYPERYFDVGIAEQHALTFAAGLATEGYKPVVAIYSTFLQRAYDQLIHDIALQNLPVVFAIDRAGLVGADGPTHAGAYDLSFLRCIPNMTIMTPTDENECRQMLYTAVNLNTPCAVRYPRGNGRGITAETVMQNLPIGKGRILRHGKRIALLVFGSPLSAALEAAETLDASVADMRFVKPLDVDLVSTLAHDHELLVSVEENSIMGGAGSAVSEWLHSQRLPNQLLQLGLPDKFIEHGDHQLLLELCGLDAKGILDRIRQSLIQ
jgi:1-deoxy-D-xylulose-5-phosphate synthase